MNWFNQTGWVAVVTLTDRPQSVCSCYVIDSFVGVFVLSLCFLNFLLVRGGGLS